MTKTLLSAALIAGLGIAAFAPSTARATDGTININGAVTGSTCTVQVNGAASPATVTLPTVSTTALGAAGNTAGETAFKINLSACGGSPTASKASVYFENGANVNSSGRLVNTVAGNNVEVQLLNSDDTVIAVGSKAAVPATGPGVFAISGSPGTATMNYFARYYATGAATPGAVTTSVQFSVIYQ